jgi:LAO/AO transport system kinase
MGDDVQALKAGVMEIADIFVLNKSDLPGIDKLEQDLHSTLSLGPRGGRRSEPAIVRTIASEGTGIDDLLAAIRAASEPRP